MPEANDCTFDYLVKDYVEIELDRMNNNDMERYIRSSLTEYFSWFTERELIDHINDQEFEETADEIISTHYGTNPPDCFITGWQLTKWYSIPTRGAFFVYNKNVHTKEHFWKDSN